MELESTKLDFRRGPLAVKLRGTNERHERDGAFSVPLLAGKQKINPPPSPYDIADRITVQSYMQNLLSRLSIRRVYFLFFFLAA
jgi:hypothetical protein